VGERCAVLEAGVRRQVTMDAGDHGGAIRAHGDFVSGIGMVAPLFEAVDYGQVAEVLPRCGGQGGIGNRALIVETSGVGAGKTGKGGDRVKLAAAMAVFMSGAPSGFGVPRFRRVQECLRGLNDFGCASQSKNLPSGSGAALAGPAGNVCADNTNQRRMKIQQKIVTFLPIKPVLAYLGTAQSLVAPA